MKDISKNYLHTPKKEGFTSFTRFDKTPSGEKLSTPISDKKINSVLLNHEGQAIFKSPFAQNLNGQHQPASYIMYSQISPGYQNMDIASIVPPQSSHMLDVVGNLENSFSPLKREEKNQNQPVMHALSSYPYRYSLFSNAESPYQDKNNNNNHNSTHYETQNHCYQHPNQDHIQYHHYEHIERDVIYNEQNDLSKMACQVLVETIKSEESDISGSSIVLKKPKFIIEFADDSELQEFQNSDEFKIIQKKLDYSHSNFIFDIPRKYHKSNGIKSLFSGSHIQKKMTNNQRTPPSQLNQYNRYVSSSPQGHPYSHRQFMMPPMNKRGINASYYGHPHPSPYFYYNEYPMPHHPAHIQSPKFHSNSQQKHGVFYNKDANNISKLNANNQFITNEMTTAAHPPKLQEKKVGKILFNNSNKKHNQNSQQNEASGISEADQKSKNVQKEKESEESSILAENQIEEYNEKIAKQVLRGEDILTEGIEEGDTNTLGIPLNDEQKQILKEKLKSIHNKPDSTFLEQQIEIIEKKAAEKLNKSNKKNKNKEEVQINKSEVNKDDEEIEEVEVKHPQASAAKKSILKQEVEQQEDTNELINSKADSNIKNSLSTAKKARSSSKTELNNQDSLNKKRRHFDTPNGKRNEFSTPSTKKKYDQQFFKKQQESQAQNSDTLTLSTTKTLAANEKNKKKSGAASNNLSLHQQSQQEQKSKANQSVSDFSNEVCGTKKQTQCKDQDECSHSHHNTIRQEEYDERAMMAEDENLSGEADQREEDSDDNGENDKKECCGCKKTKCLKLYCECFQAMRYCVGQNCQGCLNKPEYDDLRKQAMDSISQRNSSAFEPKVDKTEEVFESASGQKIHSKGCNCKKSDCRKKYCECFQMGAKCTNLCKCFNCKNRADSNHHQFSGSKQGMPIHPLFFMDGNQIPHHLQSSHLPPPPPPHHLGVPPPIQFRGNKQGPIYFYGGHPPLHGHKGQGGYGYEQWNHYYNNQEYLEYNYPRKVDTPSYGQSQSQQLSEYDNTPRFNSAKRQQIQVIQKSSFPVKDFSSSSDKD